MMLVALNVSASNNLFVNLFLAPASQVPANIVFLVLLMFLIFEHPIQILFRINLVSVIKCYWACPTE